MVDFDNLKDQVEKAAADHPDVVARISDEVIEPGGDVASRAVGDKYAEILLKGARAVDDGSARRSDRHPPRPHAGSLE